MLQIVVTTVNAIVNAQTNDRVCLSCSHVGNIEYSTRHFPSGGWIVSFLLQRRIVVWEKWNRSNSINCCRTRNCSERSRYRTHIHVGLGYIANAVIWPTANKISKLGHADRPDKCRQISQKRCISAGEQWNVFDDMCRMARWSFWSWFDVNRSISAWGYARKKLHFRSQWPWLLTFWP